MNPNPQHETPEPKMEVVDLVASLRASIEAAKARRVAEYEARRTNGGES